MTDILDRLEAARAPYAASKAFDEARVHNACLDAQEEIGRLREVVELADDVLRVALKVYGPSPLIELTRQKIAATR